MAQSPATLVKENKAADATWRLRHACMDGGESSIKSGRSAWLDSMHHVFLEICAISPAKDLVLLARLNARVTEDSRGIHTRHEQDSFESIWQRTIKPFGRGGMGEVYREQCISGNNAGQLRAVKAIQKHNSRAAPTIDYSRELEAIARFSQPQYERCFVKSFGWYENVDTVFIAMEYVEHGDLQQYVGICMAEIEVQQIAAQVLEGLAFLHASGYAHRDLKPANLLVSSKRPQWHIKIADFGLSKRVIEDLTSLRTQGGTPGYMAPEQMALGYEDDEDSDDESKLSYTNAVDIWAVGVISFVMLTGNLPFLASDRRRLKKYVQGKVPFPSDALLAKLISIQGCAWIESCMAPRPSDRPSAGFSRRHAWPMGSGSLEPGMNPSPTVSTPETTASASWTTQDSGYRTAIHLPLRQSAAQTQTVMPYPDIVQVIVDDASRGNAGIECYSSAGKELANDGPEMQMSVFSPGGRVLATTSSDKTVRLWDHVSGVEAGILDTREYVSLVVFSGNGQLVATAVSEGGVIIWETTSTMVVRKLEHTYRWRMNYPRWLVGVAFSPNGRLVATASHYDIVVWDTVSWKKMYSPYNYEKTIEDEPGELRVTDIAFLPDARLAVLRLSSSGSAALSFWDLSSRKENITRLAGQRRHIWGTAFSPDGRLVATGYYAGPHASDVTLWDKASGKVARELRGHRDHVCSVAFSPNGQVLASASSPGDNTVKLWDVATGKQLTKLEDYQGRGVAFSPNGHLLIMPSVKGTIRIWDLHAILSLTDSQLHEIPQRLRLEAEGDSP